MARSRRSHRSCRSCWSSSSASGGGADGGPGQVGVSCSGVPSGGGGAPFLTLRYHLERRTLRCRPVPDPSGTFLTIGRSRLFLANFHCSRTNVPLSLRKSAKKKRVCDVQKLHLRTRRRSSKSINFRIKIRNQLDNTNKNSQPPHSHLNNPPPAEPHPVHHSPRTDFSGRHTHSVDFDPFAASFNLLVATLCLILLTFVFVSSSSSALLSVSSSAKYRTNYLHAWSRITWLSPPLFGQCTTPSQHIVGAMFHNPCLCHGSYDLEFFPQSLALCSCSAVQPSVFQSDTSALSPEDCFPLCPGIQQFISFCLQATPCKAQTSPIWVAMWVV